MVPWTPISQYLSILTWIDPKVNFRVIYYLNIRQISVASAARPSAVRILEREEFRPPES